MYRQWVVTALLAWPALAALVVLLAPVRWAKHLALAASLIEFPISAPLWWTFAPPSGHAKKFGPVLKPGNSWTHAEC